MDTNLSYMSYASAAGALWYFASTLLYRGVKISDRA